MECSNFSYLFFIQNEGFFGLFLEVFHTPSFILTYYSACQMEAGGALPGSPVPIMMGIQPKSAY